MPQSKSKVVHVAVGVVMRGQQVLISWRNAGQHQGNRYEFPGGKIDPHETAQQGLIRELKEELGIEVTWAIRAQQLEFAYPEKTVCLHIFKVTDFKGEPVGQEGQPVLWVKAADLHQYQFPDANAPILKMVHLPEQYVICRELLNSERVVDWLTFHVQSVAHGAWLYVRQPQLAEQQYVDVIQQLAAQRPDLKLIAMSRHYAALTGQLGYLSGVHLSQHELMQAQDLQDYAAGLFRFAACHDAGSILQANRLKLDAIVLSPLHQTATHHYTVALGWDNWKALALHSQVPVYALGGVQPDELAKVQQHAGFGVAGIRAFMKTANPVV